MFYTVRPIAKFLLFFTLLFSSVNVKAFTFDMWDSGMTIEDMVFMSSLKDIQIRAKNASSATRLKGFDPALLGKDPKIRQFFYKGPTLGFDARYDLFFTSTSNRLYRVDINWQKYLVAAKAGIDSYKALVDGVVTSLNEKYGDSNFAYDRVIGASNKPANHVWKTADGGTIFLWGVKGSALIVRYVDSALLAENKLEIAETLKEKTTEILTRDVNKF